MKQVKTQGIVIRRVNYGEADRIITFLTPDQGKPALIAKGVRKSGSKLAGGVELFSVSELNYIIGKREIHTLTSSRLKVHYGNIVKELSRTELAYEVISIINKATEDTPEAAYFSLLDQTLASLDDLELDIQLINLWFKLQLLKLSGHMPDLQNDVNGASLSANKTYDFHLDQMRFNAQDHRQGAFRPDHIKFLRLAASAAKPAPLQRINNCSGLAEATRMLVQSMLSSYVRI